MTELNRLTIICVDCYSYGKAVAALQKCNEQVKAARTVLLTNIPLSIDDIEVTEIPNIKSKEEYSRFIIKELYKYFDTDYVLIIQHDGFILNGDCWNDEFYNYDYIGAPWLYADGKNVGNGGFSLRSRKLQKILYEDEFITATDPEDACIGRTYRDYLIKEYDIKFPTEEFADTFSFELTEPICKTFGFHGNFHEPFRPTIIIKRSGALGDCLILEPVLRYYAAKGYSVVLDIPIAFFDLYSNHYFQVKHISKFDSGRIKPEKTIDLDLAYEVKPRQSYLKSYFEFCGITDYVLSKPKFSTIINDTKLFKRYACVHIDERLSTPHRNIYGVNWNMIERYLVNRGYTVLQVGRNKHENCGIEINTQSVAFMKYVISGCDLFIGIDSAPAGIAVAYNKPCVLFFGSVNPDYVHPDLTNIKVVQGSCDNAFCWHSKNAGVAGVECKYKDTTKYLQCCKSDSYAVIEAIETLTR